MKTKNKSRKLNVKSTKGQPGAPKKAVKYPRGNFTVASAITFNKGVACGLTVRNRITEDVKAGLLAENGFRPQPNNKVGRPSTLFILASLAKTVKAKAKSTPTPKATRKVKANTVTLAPVVDVTPAVPTPAPVTPTAPAVEVVETAEKNIAPVVPAPLP